MKTGKWIVIDGLDGIGKGEIERAIIDHESAKGTNIFNLHHYWAEKHEHPTLNLFNKHQLLISAEPTRVWTGASIKREIIANNERKYSTISTAHAYAVDRLVLMKMVIHPALENGINVLQSRSVLSSMIYQSVQAKENNEDLDMHAIMELEGNKLELENPPYLLIIPVIKNVDELIERLRAREKQDNCQFETLDFQRKLKPFYESPEIKEIFEKRGTIVEYVDVGISIEETRRQGLELWKKYMED